MEVERPRIIGEMYKQYITDRVFGTRLLTQGEGIAVTQYVLLLEQVIAEFIKKENNETVQE